MIQRLKNWFLFHFSTLWEERSCGCAAGRSFACPYQFKFCPIHQAELDAMPRSEEPPKVSDPNDGMVYFCG